MTLLTVDLPASLLASLKAGHPWVYRDHVPKGFAAPNGTWVRLRCDRWEAFGLWDAESPLAIRVYSRKGVPDAKWLREQLVLAYARREPLRARGDTSAYRLLFGEGDGVPGVVVDLYGDYAVIQLDSNAAGRIVPWVVDALRDVVPQLRGVVRRHKNADKRLELLWGELPPERLVVSESGLWFVANLFAGQKTGLFLDHRENRRFVGGLCSGLSVLNLFSYTGAFSVYAAQGGATRVVSVDVSAPAAQAAEENFLLNGLDKSAHAFIARDAFEYLADRGGERFDVIVCDPPSFARNKLQAKKARVAYSKLNAAALGALNEGGLLATASCTTQVGPEDFRRVLVEAGQRAGRRLEIVHEAGQPLDHPVGIGHPEGRYLKFLAMRARSWP